MKFLSAVTHTAIFAALLVLSPVCAFAAPGVVNTTVNLRQGPGTSTPIVGRIPAGSRVDVVACSGEWCQTTFQGMGGYVIATALAQGGPPGGSLRAAPPPSHVYGGPPPGYASPPPGYIGPPPYPYPSPYYGGPYDYGYGPYWRRW